MKKIKYSKFDYDCFIEEFVTDPGGDAVEITKNVKVAICKVGCIGFLEYDGTLKLLNVFEGDIYNYQDEKVLFIDPTDPTKGFEIFESIVSDTSEGFIEYLLDMEDVEKDKIDPKIYELDGKVDFFITSNEDIL